MLKQQEQQYKQKIIDLETELHNKIDTTSYKSESEEANQLLAQELENKVSDDYFLPCVL